MNNNITELKRLQWNRNYFEEGCLCIRDGELKKLPSNINNAFAIEHYERNCKCSRNYVHLEEFQDPERERGTGRTTDMIMKAPVNTTVVTYSSGNIPWMRQLIHDLGSKDIIVKSARSFTDSLARGRYRNENVLFDHTVFELVKEPQIIDAIHEFITESGCEFN